MTIKAHSLSQNRRLTAQGADFEPFAPINGTVQMDAIIKDSKEWLAALQFAEKWEPNQRCMKQDGFQWCDIHNDDGDHDIPPPDITSDLLYAIRRAIEARGYLWALRYWNRGSGREYEFAINDGMKLIGWAKGSSEAEAIIRAAASLQETR